MASNRKFVADIVVALDFDRNCHIHVPGVGQSHLAHDLIQTHGFTSIVVSDLNARAIEYQTCLLGDTAEIVPHDDLLAVDATVGRRFDVVVDSSVMDVFIANGGVETAQAVLKSRLAKNGVMVVLSMNHRRVLHRLKATYADVLYTAIEQYSGNHRNPKNVRRDVAVFVALQSDNSGLMDRLPLHSLLVHQAGGQLWARKPQARDLGFQSMERMPSVR